ncbi:MAG: endonuclease domain-containing protein [Caulobacter sp.]
MQPLSTITLARSLRKSMTWSEQRLWHALRGKRLNGVRFRRQHVLGPYVVDFFCSASQLAIEIDGGIHEGDDRQLHDAQRDAWMAARGVRVLRLSDRLVRDNLDAALGTISEAATTRPPG